MRDLPEWYIILSAVFAVAVATNIHGYALFQAITHPAEFLQTVMSSDIAYRSAFAQINIIPPELIATINMIITLIIGAIAFAMALVAGVAIKRLATLIASKLPRRR